jgi:hypothetical protein
MGKIQKIENRQDIVRDTRSGAIISIDEGAYKAHLRRRALADAQQKTITQLGADVAELKTQLRALINRDEDEVQQ